MLRPPLRLQGEVQLLVAEVRAPEEAEDVPRLGLKVDWVGWSLLVCIVFCTCVF